MEILSSGSFINLENQEKIEQLKFTASELANAALETEGFVNDDESGKCLALEFWQGLEYMCRENEEATIQNIFFNHFLERLREFRTTQPAAKIELLQDSAQFVSEQIDNETKPKDEFLGVISTSENDETSIQTEDFSTSGNDFAQEVEVETAENVFSESVAETSAEKEVSDSENPVQAKAVMGNLCLPEKEPYQFNKCTVTATIQLLPAGDEQTTRRKAVLSVRTHDFAPQISMVELVGSNLVTELMPELENVLARYQSDLPAKVMDKLKKEKNSSKKLSPKVTAETKMVAQDASKPQESVKSQNAPTEVSQTTSAVIPQAVETGGQGSLFGF